MTPLVELLSKTELFGGLAANELSACANLFREVKFTKGQSLFVRGEQATSLYLVAHGRVRIAIVTDCPSSDNLRLIRRFEKGGSGSSGVRV